MSSTLVRAGLAAVVILLGTTSLALAETSATPAAKSTTVAQSNTAPPPANFGSPPSGSIPILYNDHHVYAKPDLLKQNRVLAALVMNGTLLIPLRSMFEQMGATVSYDPATKTSTVTKPGAEIKVTVGKPEVLINGESRPLDVSPIAYQGDILVPVRVISEGMGAYVQWVPSQPVVVVRYIPPTPPPTAPPTEAPAPPSTPVPAPVVTPTPNPFTWRGFFRSYYFTRQNASNNPGTQWNPAKYNSNAVNQASLNNAIDLHADYQLPFSGWYVGATYFFAEPFSGPCSVAPAHAKGKPCVSQSPPNTNPDDTLPGFMLNTFPESYVGFKDARWKALAGDYEFSTPWAGPYDATRMKPVAYQGADATYAFTDALSLDVGDFWAFQNRTSNSFTNNTLLTTYPAGGGGIANNIFVPGCSGAACNGITTSGFTYGRLGYAPKDADYSVNGYFYGIHDIVTMFYGDARYTFSQSSLKPYVALQGGWENNGGNSVIGKINSQLMGIQVGVNATKNVLVQAGFDYIPWKNDTVPTAYLSSINWTCGNSNFTLKPAVGSVTTHTLPYFLPLNAGQCFANAANGTTSIYYGGWASPYTDNYATDPIFTTSISQGMADRRAPGTSWKIGATFTSNNKRFIFLATDAWYNYGNALVAENTNEWNLDGTYRLSPVPKTGFYKGLALRYRYMQRSLTNTYCGAAGSSCPAGATSGSTYLGGLPLFKYNRAQLEYDF